jgi:hypothetical protein
MLVLPAMREWRAVRRKRERHVVPTGGQSVKIEKEKESERKREGKLKFENLLSL